MPRCRKLPLDKTSPPRRRRVQLCMQPAASAQTSTTHCWFKSRRGLRMTMFRWIEKSHVALSYLVVFSLHFVVARVLVHFSVVASSGWSDLSFCCASDSWANPFAHLHK